MTTHPFWIEHDENGNPINNLWVKIDNIPAGQTKTIYVHTDGSNSPDGDSVFEFFDDFDGSNLDTNKWNATGTTWTVSNGYIIGDPDNSDGDVYLTSIATFNYDFIVDYRLKPISANSSGYASFIRLKDGLNDIIFFIRSSTSYDSVLSQSEATDGKSEYISTGQWKNAYLINGPTLYAQWDGSSLFTISRQATGNFAVELQAHKGTTAFDAIRVRKYIANEPSITVTQIDSATYKVDIVNNEITDLTDYQIAIPLSEIPDITSSTQTLDITDGAYSYWIEHDENNNPQNYVWVKIDSLPASSTKTIYANKTSGFSPNGDAVFEFFDDFEGSSLNTSKWSSNTGTVSDSKLQVVDTITATIPINQYVVTWYGKRATSGYETWFGIGNWDERTPDGAYASWRDYYGSGTKKKFTIEHTAWEESTYDYSSDSTDSWYHFDLILADSNINWKLFTKTGSSLIDYSTTKSASLTDVNTLYFVKDPDRDVTDMQFDYVFVRKYTTTEPTVSVTDMGTYYKIDITNNEASELTGYQVAIPINDLNVTSTTESIKFTDTLPEQPSEVNKALHFSHNC